MTDAHTPNPSDTEDDDEYMLLPTKPAAIAAFIVGLTSNGIAVEEAVVEMPSGDSPGSLSLEFREDTLEQPNVQEGDR